MSSSWSRLRRAGDSVRVNDTWNESELFPDPLTGRAVRRLTNQGRINQTPTYHTNSGFTADGRYSVFASVRQGQTWVIAAEVETGDLRALWQAPGTGDRSYIHRGMSLTGPDVDGRGICGNRICPADADLLYFDLDLPPGYWAGGDGKTPRVWLLDIGSGTVRPLREEYPGPFQVHQAWLWDGSAMCYHGGAAGGGEYFGVAEAGGRVRWERVFAQAAFYGRNTPDARRNAPLGFSASRRMTASLRPSSRPCRASTVSSRQRMCQSSKASRTGSTRARCRSELAPHPCLSCSTEKV